MRPNRIKQLIIPGWLLSLSWSLQCRKRKIKWTFERTRAARTEESAIYWSNEIDQNNLVNAPALSMEMNLQWKLQSPYTRKPINTKHWKLSQQWRRCLCLYGGQLTIVINIQLFRIQKEKKEKKKTEKQNSGSLTRVHVIEIGLKSGVPVFVFDEIGQVCICYAKPVRSSCNDDECWRHHCHLEQNKQSLV